MTAVEFASKLITRGLKYKLTLPQFGALLSIASGFKTDVKISNKLRVKNKGSFVAVLKSLVEKGYVTISPVGMYELTTTGKCVLYDIFNIKSNWM